MQSRKTYHLMKTFKQSIHIPIPIVILQFIVFILITGCKDENKQSNDQKSIVNDSLTSQDTFSLKGLWVMPDYIDSVLTYKTISKYRMQWPTWFAILIDIDDDTIRTYGSINDLQTSYNGDKDTICVFEKTVTGKWMLSFNEETQKLELRHIKLGTGRNEKDPKVYVLEKRPELSFLLDSLDKIHKTRTNMKNYLSKELFEGTYEVVGENRDVIFQSNNKIKGFQDFTEYHIDVYYGTSHPFNNLDNIKFYRNQNDNQDFNWEMFHWKFKGDTLILTPLIFEEFKHRGKKVRGEFLELSEKQIKLVRK